MPIRRVAPVSDRGSIRDLEKRKEEGVAENPPIPFEVRMAALYEVAERDRNTALMDSLGFIVMDKPANPVSVYRLREKVKDITERHGKQIDDLYQQIAPVFGGDGAVLVSELRNLAYKKAKSLDAILDSKESSMVKTASLLPKRSFRRVV